MSKRKKCFGTEVRFREVTKRARPKRTSGAKVIAADFFSVGEINGDNMQRVVRRQGRWRPGKHGCLRLHAVSS